MSMQSIESRRSIRKFREDMIPMELIDQVLAAGIKAPSSKNKQPWRFVVVGGKAKEEMLGLFEAGLTREQNGQALLPKNRNALPDAWNTLKVMKQAPVIIMVLNEESGSPFEAVSNEDRVAEIANREYAIDRRGHRKHHSGRGRAGPWHALDLQYLFCVYRALRVAPYRSSARRGDCARLSR